jgi:hypothetical protein
VRHRAARLALASVAVVALVVGAPASALAHTVQHAGPYTLEIGWLVEPTYVGVPNAVSVTIHDAADKPITDLGADDLHVVVTTNSQPSSALSFEPGFDPIEMDGPLGEYDAAIVPTAPGDYSFHITGTIHGQAVDINVTSGDETFDPVKESTDLQFPTKLPSISEISTRLDRIDARVTALSGGTTGPTQADVDAAKAAAAGAKDTADFALILGASLGGAGLLVGALGLLVAWRATRRPA